VGVTLGMLAFAFPVALASPSTLTPPPTANLPPMLRCLSVLWASLLSDLCVVWPELLLSFLSVDLSSCVQLNRHQSNKLQVSPVKQYDEHHAA
jgi:hypothetical protein